MSDHEIIKGEKQVREEENPLKKGEEQKTRK